MRMGRRLWIVVLAGFAMMAGRAGADMDYEFEGHGAPLAQAAIDPNVIVSLVLWLQPLPAPEVEHEFKPSFVHFYSDPD